METRELSQYNTQFTPEKSHTDDKSAAGDFCVEDLLNFPDDDVDIVVDDGVFEAVPGTSTSTSTVVDRCNFSSSGSGPHFSDNTASRSLPEYDAQFYSDLCVPDAEAAELEWLSNFLEESFSTQDSQKLQALSGMKACPDQGSDNLEFQPQQNPNKPTPLHQVPGKARSKRSRSNWTSRLLQTLPPPKKIEGGDDAASGSGGDGRRCLHCATDKTPQWRIGPMGPKTLCNACGVRYKLGRLVPEYRPAASPTFVLTKHSNSHRKVLELRMHKELLLQRAHQHSQQPQQKFVHQCEAPDGDDNLIHQQIGPNFREMV